MLFIFILLLLFYKCVFFSLYLYSLLYKIKFIKTRMRFMSILSFIFQIFTIKVIRSMKKNIDGIKTLVPIRQLVTVKKKTSTKKTILSAAIHDGEAIMIYV